MPIYEFACETCGAYLELLLPRGQNPEICGGHCKLAADQPDHAQGHLKRCISRPADVRRPESINREGPTTKQAGDAGFAVYKKSGEGPGHYRKETGKGPDTIQR
jgi:hypothetical protein